MSYSRWGSRGSGHWYTFWCSRPKDTENRDTAIFCVCNVIDFEAKELREDIDACLKRAGDADEAKEKGDLEELQAYMLEFLADVDEDYPEGESSSY